MENNILKMQWKSFFSTGNYPNNISHTIFDSWKRCFLKGIIPYKKTNNGILPEEQYEEIIKKNEVLIEASNFIT